LRGIGVRGCVGIEKAERKPERSDQMNYQVIARKYRPQTFRDLVGQSHVTATLANAIKNNRVAHAYIFSGARGVGKTTAARILAKAMNCVHGPTADPCGVCDSCKEIASGNSLDVIEIDAASNRGIDQIRELREMVRYAPAASRSKVVILDEAHMLTDEASNALLKTLEEPPERVIFVMATTQPEDLGDTIRSRSQHFHFRALTFAEIASRIEEIVKLENLKIEPGAVAVIARMAEGSLRDALSLLEQARAYCGDSIPDAEVRELLGVVPEDTLNELDAAIAEGSADRALGLVHTLQKEGRNLQHFCREAIRHIRNLLVARVCGADSDLIAATPDQRPALAKAAAQFSEEDLTRFFQILLQTDDDLRRKPDPRVHLEMGLLRLINAQRLAPMEDLLAELRPGSATSAAGAAGTGGRRASAPESAAVAPSVRAFSPPFSAASSSRPTAVAPGPTPAWQTPPASQPAQLATQPNASSPAIAVAPPARAVAPGFAAPATAPAREEIRPDTKPGPAAAELKIPEANEAFAEAAEDAEVEAELERKETAAPADANGATRPEGVTPEQVAEIKSAIQAQQKFLGEIIAHAHRWELDGAELRIYFSAEKRAFAEMMEGRDALEKVRSSSSKVLGRAVRVCARVEVAAGGSARGASSTQELRGQFERDPMVRSLLQRFGGRISEVKWRQEGS
jgi:DNA polymerase III subunit gamma/tau